MKYKHILVAVDLAESNDKIIERAVYLAESVDAKLSFIYVNVGSIHIAGDTSAYIGGDLSGTDIDDASKRVFNKKYHAVVAELQALCETVNYPVSNTVVVGDEQDKELTDAIKKLNVDLFISGHHHEFWNSWWSFAHKLVDHMVVDLLLIRV